jgi:hypothetical protein
MSSVSEQPYRDIEDDEGRMASSVDKSVSKDQIFGPVDTAPKMHEGSRNIETFNLDFEKGDGSYRTRERRKPCLIFWVACTFTFM